MNLRVALIVLLALVAVGTAAASSGGGPAPLEMPLGQHADQIRIAPENTTTNGMTHLSAQIGANMCPDGVCEAYEVQCGLSTYCYQDCSKNPSCLYLYAENAGSTNGNGEPCVRQKDMQAAQTACAKTCGTNEKNCGGTCVPSSSTLC